MKIYFIANARMPSEKAYGIHIAKSRTWGFRRRRRLACVKRINAGVLRLARTGAGRAAMVTGFEEI